MAEMKNRELTPGLAMNRADQAVARHGLVDEGDRLCAGNLQREEHLRKDKYTRKGKDRQDLWDFGHFNFFKWFLRHGNLHEYGRRGLAVLDVDFVNPVEGALGKTDLQYTILINRGGCSRIDEGRELQGAFEIAAGDFGQTVSGLFFPRAS